MDYYGPMVHPFRRIRPAALACVAATCVFPALAQTGERASEPASAPVQEEEEATAALNAELFYELLLGEITTSEGDPATGYNLMLDAARRSGDPQLYRRATEIALQSRSGEYALAAARAWKEALPQSRDANRYLLRILVALNRIGDSAEPLRQELASSSARDSPSAPAGSAAGIEGRGGRSAPRSLTESTGSPLSSVSAGVSSRIGRSRLVHSATMSSRFSSRLGTESAGLDTDRNTSSPV